jgi:mevalonate kinase
VASSKFIAPSNLLDTAGLTRYLFHLFLPCHILCCFYLMKNSPAFDFTTRATLPVGAGLGSSASFSVCTATAILLIHRRIGIPKPPAPNDPATGHIHASHQGQRALSPIVAEEVNRWAFISEKILHGNPSGVDNSVAVYGGALGYTRPGFTRKSGMDPIQGWVPKFCLRL